MPLLDKLEVARRQLGTALWLFLEDLDPVSVHTLAGAGGELSEQLARRAGGTPFVQHALLTDPGMTPAQYYALLRRHYNSFKHFTRKDGSSRDDHALLAEFSDDHNYASLFISWTDFMAASPSTPIEAQIFQVWFFCMYPEKLPTNYDPAHILSVFPDLLELDRGGQKNALKLQIARSRTDGALMMDLRTDNRPLLLGGIQGN